MARVISDAEVWTDLAARILASTQVNGAEPTEIEVEVLTAMTAEALGIERERVRDVYFSRIIMFGG